MIDLLLDGQRVTLDPDEQVRLNKALNDIGKFQEAKGVYSNSLKVIRTPEMDSFFGFPAELYGSFETVYKRFEAVLQYEGVDILEAGFAYIEDFDDNHYTLTVASGSSDLFALIEGKNLDELDFRELDHRYTAANVNANRANTEGFVYPDINYGGQWDAGAGSSHKVFSCWRPAVFVSSIVKKIINEAGYSIHMDSELLAEPLYNEMIIPQSGAFKRSSNPSRMDFAFTVQSFTNGSLSMFQTLPLTGFVGSEVFYNRSGNLFASNVERTKVRLLVTISINTMTAPCEYRLYLPGGATYASVTVPNTGARDIEFDLTDSVWYEASPTEGFRLWADNGTTNPYVVFGGSMSAKAVAFVDGLTLEEQQDGSIFLVKNDATAFNGFRAVEGRGLMPDLEQSELLKMVYMFFGVLQVTDNENKVVRLELLKNLPEKPPKKLEIDLAEKPSFKPYFGDYGRVNRFEYPTDDNDPLIAPNPTLGRGELVCAYGSAPPVQEVFKAPLHPCAASLAFTTHQVFMVNIPTADNVKPKIARAVITTTGNSIVVDGYGTPTTWSATTWSGLSFSESLPVYYGSFAESIRLPMEVSCKVKLNASQFKAFDFAVPYEIDYFNAMFYVNEIEEFNPEPGESTTIKLILIR